MPRPDVAAYFPGLNNTSASGGKYTFDSRHLKNGIHTIAWSVHQYQSPRMGASRSESTN